MPQVHNKSITLDGNAFGKNSRFMNTLKFSDTTKRRVRAFNVVENKLNKIRLNYYNRQEEIEYNRMQREKEFLLVKLKRLVAYKKVAHDHSISNAVNYQDALNEDRSHRQVQKQIQDMILELSPQYVREKRAKEKIAAAKQRYDDIINRNRKDLDKIYPPPKLRQPYENEGDEEPRSNVTTPKSAPPEMNAEMRMRRLSMANTRRVIGFTRAFVMEKSNLGEKLEKEKTQIEKEKTSTILPTQEEIAETSRTEPVDVVKTRTELPPVAVRRRASMNDLNKQTKRQKRSGRHELPPVAVTKTLKPELDIRTD